MRLGFVKPKTTFSFATALAFHYLCGNLCEIMEEYHDIIFDRNSVEFVTVAAEYCAFLEKCQQQPISRRRFVDTTVKLLPLLYLKATLIPECETIGFEEPDAYVTEESYERMRSVLAEIMGDKDDYLEVFTPDMAYSEGALPNFISEDLCDIYQALRDFIFIFRQGINETMHDALAICRERFEDYWGQTLVNTLRALHEAKYKDPDTEEDEEENGGLLSEQEEDDAGNDYYDLMDDEAEEREER
jgi:hypothetical protein